MTKRYAHAAPGLLQAAVQRLVRSLASNVAHAGDPTGDPGVQTAKPARAGDRPTARRSERIVNVPDGSYLEPAPELDEGAGAPRKSRSGLEGGGHTPAEAPRRPDCQVSFEPVTPAQSASVPGTNPAHARSPGAIGLKRHATLPQGVASAALGGQWGVDRLPSGSLRPRASSEFRSRSRRSGGTLSGGCPTARLAHERLHVIRPVVQRRRIEIGAVGPREGVHLGIQADRP